MAGRSEADIGRPAGDVPRTVRRGGDAAVANEAGLAALGAEMRHVGSRRSVARHAAVRSGRRRRLRRGALIALAIVVVLVGGAGWYFYDLTHDLTRVAVKGLKPTPTTGADAGAENILMVGSTSRCALAQQNPAYGLCFQGVNGVNSDVIMILHANPAQHKLALLSIPRDLFVPNARAAGANKIDAGLVQGMSQVVASIEEDFGIPIQHAVSLNFDQFANVVQALGGIDMKFPVSLFDWGGLPPPNGTGSSGLNIQAAACVHLDGTQALEVVRARHLRYETVAGSSDPYYWTQEPLSDLARIDRDHEFLRVLATAVAKQNLDNPVTDIGLINSLKSDLTFDNSWSVDDMAHLVLDFHSVDINSVPQLTLPVAEVVDPDGPDGSYMYAGGGPYGDVEFPAQSEDQAAIDRVLGIGAATDSMTGKPLPAPSTVTVSVENGSGVTSQAADTATALAALGFHTLGTGTIAPVGDVAETTVDYGSRSPAIEAAAEAVARSMTGSVIMSYAPNQVTDGAQVTVDTGTQFQVDAPPSSTSASSTTSTTSTTSPTLATSAIAAPSPSNPRLTPWDPEACAAGATPTAPVHNRT